MQVKTFSKWLVRSRSPRFVRDRFAKARPDVLRRYSWNGIELHYRPGTSDQGLIYEILLRPGAKADYWLPEYVDAKVVLDIGANIGIASVFLAHRFPNARIYSFEPVPANFTLLTRNIETLGNVTAVQKALGKADGSFEMFHSDSQTNLGGYSFHEAGSNVGQRVVVQVREARSMMRELGLDSADVIKIDTEGSEYDILTSLGKEFLENVKWIYGELHGNRDFELLAFLSDQFDIGVKRTMGKRLFMFQARNKSVQAR